MSNIYKAVVRVTTKKKQYWRTEIANPEAYEFNSEGEAQKVEGYEYFIAESKKEVEGLLSNSLKNNLIFLNVEFVRKATHHDSAFSDLYPSFSRWVVKEGANSKFYFKDKKTKLKVSDFKSRIECVNAMIKFWEKGN